MSEPERRAQMVKTMESMIHTMTVMKDAIASGGPDALSSVTMLAKVFAEMSREMILMVERVSR